MKHAVSILINDIMHCLPQPIILVLDDLHFVTESAVHVVLDYLLEQLPPNLHVVISTRHDPLAIPSFLKSIRYPRTTSMQLKQMAVKIIRPSYWFTA